MQADHQAPGAGGGRGVPVYVHHIATLVPPHAYPQAFAMERMAGWVADDTQRRLARQVYRRSGIDTRYSVLADFLPGAAGTLFTTDARGRLVEPGTRARNERFAQEARRLAVAAVRRALNGCPAVAPADVTHVITSTCTGAVNPGPDYYIVRDLDLPAAVQRYALGFMGCYAALPALHMAAQFCRADPAAVVLVVAIELCSLHLHVADGLDALLANALFADGAAAALVSARPPLPGRPVLQWDGAASALVPAGERDMAWRIGDQGFEITLSAYVPDVLGAHLAGLVGAQLAPHGVAAGDIAWWAIHPGGRAILDRAQQALGLRDEQLAASRDVLRRYGNMSSATILFVLQALLEAAGPGAGAERVCALAFGPGLTVEAALLRRLAL